MSAPLCKKGSAMTAQNEDKNKLDYNKKGYRKLQESDSSFIEAPYAGASAGNGGAPSDTHNAVLEAVAQAISDRISGVASVSDSLLDENDTVTGTAVYEFSWRKSGDEDKAFDGTPSEPQAVNFSKTALNSMFQGKVDLSKPQYVLSASIVEVKNPSPFPLRLVLDNVQEQALHCEYSNDGTPATMIILPHSYSDKKREIYRLRDIDPEVLRTHGNANLQDEYDSMVKIDDLGMVLVNPNGRIGRILKNNEEYTSETGTLNYVNETDVPMYAVKKQVVEDVLNQFNTRVIQSLPKTNFLQHTAKLSRADRTSKEETQREFADASDASNMSRAALEAAHTQKHTVFVKVQYNLIDPKKLDKDQ